MAGEPDCDQIRLISPSIFSQSSRPGSFSSAKSSSSFAACSAGAAVAGTDVSSAVCGEAGAPMASHNPAASKSGQLTLLKPAHAPLD